MNYSVLMSVYDKEKPEYLKQSIESMLNQTVKPEQFVVVEDGALNKSLSDIIDKYKADFNELFTIVKLQVNGGLGNALNQGLKASVMNWLPAWILTTFLCQGVAKRN